MKHFRDTSHRHYPVSTLKMRTIFLLLLISGTISSPPSLLTQAMYRWKLHLCFFSFSSGLFRYSLAQEEGFCSAPSVLSKESKSKPLYSKIYDSTLSPLNLQSKCNILFHRLYYFHIWIKWLMKIEVNNYYRIIVGYFIATKVEWR